ncbi:MAG: Gfo/Idh/MocA family oxidoreductase [Verrucomicrobiaceae bacterium]|nr:Gfo/Idh/MocA family oxidoreductase [Verrucomicrobiaceae bacterium]
MNSRRRFLKTTAAAALSAPWIGWKTTASGAPGDTLRFANFGANGRAWGDLTGMMDVPNVSLAAVAEVDLARTDKLQKAYPGTKVFQDWRELLDKLHKEIDAVVIGTPDHMHAPIAMAAMQLGKHVYCEKPLTRTLQESRRLREFAAANGLMTQMGIQIASTPGNQTAVKLLQEGVVGKVREIHSSCPKSWGSMEPLPESNEAPPETLDWDQWIGVGKYREYIPREFHPSQWRKRIGYGTGTLGDMGCHIYHTWFMGLGQPATLEVTSRGPAPVDGDSWPLDGLVHHRMQGNSLTDGDFDFTWYDGAQRPPAEVFALLGPEKKNAEGKTIPNAPSTGTIVVGSTGVLVIPHGGLPTIFRDGKKSDEVIEAVAAKHHHKNFVDAIRGDISGKPLTNFDYSGPMTETVLLGTVATRLKGETLKWDGSAGKFTNSDAANAMIHDTYREGWEVEGL